MQHIELHGPQGVAVDVLTNTTDENAVAVLARAHDGALSAAGTVATGGQVPVKV